MLTAHERAAFRTLEARLRELYELPEDVVVDDAFLRDTFRGFLLEQITHAPDVVLRALWHHVEDIGISFAQTCASFGDAGEWHCGCCSLLQRREGAGDEG